MSVAAPTSVYRYYDADGKLIYVGITGRGIIRQTQHNSDADWWRFVTSQEVEHVDTRREALRRERRLIEQHRPPFNTQHNPDWKRRRASYLAHVEAQASPHGGPITCEYGDPAECVGLSSINPHWCEKLTCLVCHEGWHRYEEGFEAGGENQQRVLVEDLVALCAAEHADVREAALAARAALVALVDTVGDSAFYDMLIGSIRDAVPTDGAIMEVLDHRAWRQTNPPDPWVEVPF